MCRRRRARERDPARAATRRIQVRQGIDALWLGIDAYASDHGGRYPPAAPVRPPRPDSPNAHERRSLAAYMPGWPLSPFSGQLMKAGRQPGDFRSS